MPYKITKDQLFFDLYAAFLCAKKHKSNKDYVKKFEENLYENLSELCDELWNRTYKSKPYVCFVIEYPKKREIFAANFRDRIVHHLFYNYTYALFDSTLIEDSYSCRIGKGTYYGIERLDHHIRSCSENYTKKTYVLKMDIRGYFIHINRIKLLEITENTLNRLRTHKVSGINDGKEWQDILDFDFILYLNREIILTNPTINCIFHSRKECWNGLPKSKSLFYTNENCGLPIGNLTSQLLSNVYLNILDQYIKRVLKCKHYGRYVDDFYIVSNDKEKLLSYILLIKTFLKEELFLDLHMGKTRIINSNYGVEFLGAYIKPNRIYISNQCLRRIKSQLYDPKYLENNKNLIASINSYLGLFTHYKSNNIKKLLFLNLPYLQKIGEFNDNFTKFEESKLSII